MRERMKKAISSTMKGLHNADLVSDGSLKKVMDLVEEQEYDLQLYKGKKGYRWRFLIDGNIKCIGSDWSDTMEEAEEEATMILENIWSFGERKTI